MTETQQLLEILERAYDRRSWHGTNLRGSIRGVTLRQAVWRPAPARHNIELIAGVAAHDLYHAGQIQLLKRLAR